jgi:FkbM family methyltransferase
VLTGRYEPEQTAIFQQWLRPGDVVLDVGAHAGYYTLLSAALAGPMGRVWAFEPDPANAHFLREHVRLNGLSQVVVEQSAVSDRTGTARFAAGSGSGTGHLAEQGPLEVALLRLDDYCERHGIVPNAVKIDVEGAEAAVLAGSMATIRRQQPVIFLSTHGAEVHQQCMAALSAAGYQLAPVLGTDAQTTTELLCIPAARLAAVRR